MEQTPVHDRHNPDLLKVMPRGARKVVEVGCSSGALAREYKRLNPNCTYVGIEVEPEFAQLARRFVDQVVVADIEQQDSDFFQLHGDSDIWVFGDTLEHLKDPWRVLRMIRAVASVDSLVIACIPNAQHWSVIANLVLGSFFYQDSCLLDKTHLRWFTRRSLPLLFEPSGFVIKAIIPRVFVEEQRAHVVYGLNKFTSEVFGTKNTSDSDLAALQYIVVAQRST